MCWMTLSIIGGILIFVGLAALLAYIALREMEAIDRENDYNPTEHGPFGP